MRACATTLDSELSDNELEYITALMKNEGLTDQHLEIGTAAGGTLWRLMQSYPDDSRPQFVVVDPMTYFENQQALVKDNLRQHDLDAESVDFRVGKSYELFKQALARGEQYDFIFIDGSHKYRYVMKDLCWTRLLRPGGLLCMHDYHVNTSGVIKAADWFLRRYNNYRKLDLIDTLLVIKKEKLSDHKEVGRLNMLRASVSGFIMQLKSSIKKRLAAKP